MTTYVDSRWYGPPDAVAAALAALDSPNVLGPRTLDGVAYVAVRTTGPVTRPADLAETGPELTVALLGAWADG